MPWSWDAEGKDGFNDVRNILKVDGHRHGVLFYPMKALLVSKGWTVEGTGDGATTHEFRGTTGGAGTGSGGAYDVWTADTGNDDGSAGNVSNALTWCVLKAPTGTMEILLVGTSQTSSGWDAYGNICFSHADGYAAAGIGPTTPPAAPTDEQIIFGSRPFGSGFELVAFPGNQYVHLGANSTAVNGIYGFWYATVSIAGTRENMMQLVPIFAARSWDVAPYVFLSADTGQTVKTWEKKGLTGERFYVNTAWQQQIMMNIAFWNGLSYDDPETGDLPMGEPQIIGMKSVANQEHFRGVLPDVRVRAAAADGAAVSAEYPSLTERDPDDITWLHWDDQAFPWDSTASPPTPLGGSGGTTAVEWFRMVDLAPVVVGATVTYVNRVWDSVAGPAFVRWTTTNAADPTGAAYPGPGTFGIHTSDYCVESKFD